MITVAAVAELAIPVKVAVTLFASVFPPLISLLLIVTVFPNGVEPIPLSIPTVLELVALLFNVIVLLLIVALALIPSCGQIPRKTFVALDPAPVLLFNVLKEIL